MGSRFDYLVKKKLIRDYPYFLKNNVLYETIMGSICYGCSDDMSDVDIYGFFMSPIDQIFPYKGNERIYEFSKRPNITEGYQKHHIYDKTTDTEYDINLLSIVKYFRLCMDNNPNLIDSLFTKERHVLQASSIANHVRDHRDKFLSKKSWHTFKGYAFNQLNKAKMKSIKTFVDFCTEHGLDVYISFDEVIDELKHAGLLDRKMKIHGEDGQYYKRTVRGHMSKGLDHLKDYQLIRLFQIMEDSHKNGNPSKRIEIIQKYGWDVKFGYHLVRLLDEVEQILETGTLDLERAKHQLRSIRAGEWSLDQASDFFDQKRKHLEELYHSSKLQYSCDEEQIRKLLLECIEMHYGSIEKTHKGSEQFNDLVSDLKSLLLNHGVNV